MDFSVVQSQALAFIAQNPVVVFGIMGAFVFILLLSVVTTSSDGGKRKKMSKSTRKKLDNMRGN